MAAVDDGSVEASPHHSTIRHTASSGDSEYDGYAIPNVIVNITDNDTVPGPACNDADVTNDIPFDYTLQSDHLAINTPGGVLKTQIGPWGAHAPAHTGHNDGNKKADWSGLFTSRYDEMTELSGDGDGTCHSSEWWPW